MISYKFILYVQFKFGTITVKTVPFAPRVKLVVNYMDVACLLLRYKFNDHGPYCTPTWNIFNQVTTIFLFIFFSTPSSYSLILDQTVQRCRCHRCCSHEYVILVILCSATKFQWTSQQVILYTTLYTYKPCVSRRFYSIRERLFLALGKNHLCTRIIYRFVVIRQTIIIHTTVKYWNYSLLTSLPGIYKIL